MNSIFEWIMLICFGLSWPFSVLKSWRTRTTRGKSLVFLLAIWTGYVSGIMHKLLFARDLVILAYVVNLAMVSLDILLYFRNRRFENGLSTDRRSKM